MTVCNSSIMDLPKLVVCYMSWVLLLSNVGGSGAVDITVAPQDDCVCSGQPVQFNCTAVVERTMSGGGTGTQTASQRWEITTSESTVLMVVSPPLTSTPEGYEFVSVNSVPAGRPTGLRVLSPDLSLNQATFTCIGYDPQGPDVESMPTPEITLEVGGLPEFQCSVSCPQVYSSVSDSCTVQWTTPMTASCESVTGFTVSGNGVTVNSPAQDAASLSFMTEVLEPFQNYTATVTAMSSCGNSSQCSVSFMSPKEERPAEFGVDLQFTAIDNLAVLVQYPVDSPAVREFTVAVLREDSTEEVLSGQSFPGDGSSLSLDISSLQQCMSYTVSVTATNTGGSRTASAMLSLDFLTSLNVSCEAGVDSCYLEATCVADQPGLFSGCTLNYMYTSDGGSQLMESLSGGLTLRTAVPCDNQTINYEGQLLNQAVALGCVDSGTTKCPFRGCDSLPNITIGTVTYSLTTGTLTSGTVATYSCDDGYELVGEKTRTCLVDGTWTGAEPECQVPPPFPSPTPTTSPLSFLPGWAIAIIIIIIILLVIAVVAVMLLWWRERLLRVGLQRQKQDQVEMSENASYGPLPARKQPATPGGGVANVQAPEYEEVGPAVPSKN